MQVVHHPSGSVDRNSYPPAAGNPFAPACVQYHRRRFQMTFAIRFGNSRVSVYYLQSLFAVR